MCFLFYVFLVLMNVMWFLSQKNLMDHYLGSFYLLSLLVYKVLVNDLFLIRKMPFFVLKTFFVVFVFVCLKFFVCLFVVWF